MSKATTTVLAVFPCEAYCRLPQRALDFGGAGAVNVERHRYEVVDRGSVYRFGGEPWVAMLGYGR